MAHDVFISYASKDKPTADAVCAGLEAAGIRCWMAPRDILPGQPWPYAIVEAIHDSKLMIVVLSVNSNASEQVLREVERSVHHAIPIIPFRIEEFALASAFEYYLNVPHWVDAMTGPMEDHIHRLVQTAQALLASRRAAADPTPPSAPSSPVLVDPAPSAAAPDWSRVESPNLGAPPVRAGEMPAPSPPSPRGGTQGGSSLGEAAGLVLAAPVVAIVAVGRAARKLLFRHPEVPAGPASPAFTAAAWRVLPAWMDARSAAAGDASARSAAAAVSDVVDCTVYAPATAARGMHLLVQVFAHRPEQEGLVDARARAFDVEATPRAAVSLAMEVARGASLHFQLTVPGLEVDHPVQTLVWRGRAGSVQFGVTVPTDQQIGPVVATVTVSLNSVPVGHIKFKLEIARTRPRRSARAGPIGHKAQFYERVFVSYASSDRAEVLKRVQMLPRFHIDFFQDVLSLDPGERWEQELYRHIDESDLFLLFWSSSAKQSEWVMREVRYALRRKGGDEFAPPEILPVPIEGPPPIEPPQELRHLHFNDQFLYFLAGAQK